MPFLIISGAISFVANLLIGLFVYFKNPKNRLNIFFALFSLMVSGWSVGSFLENVIPDRSLALTVLRSNYLFAVWLPAVYIHFVYSFATITPARRQILRIAYLFSAALTTVLYTPLFIRDLRVLQSQPYQFLISSPGPIYYVFFAYFVVSTCEVLRATLREAKLNSGRSRLQFRYLTIANAIAIAAGLEYFSRVFGLLKSPPWDDYILLIYLLVLAYAMVRYQLMDIHLVFTRGAIFIGVYTFVLGLPFLLAMMGQELFEGLFGRRWWGVPLGLMALLATTGHYVNLFFQRKAEARLLREQRRYQTMLLNSAKGMTQIHDLQRLLKLLGYLLVRAMKLAHAGVFLWDDNREQYVLQVQVHPPCKATSPPIECGTHEPLVLWLMQERVPVVQEEIKQLADTKRSRTVSLSRLESRLKHLDAAVVVPSFVNDRLIGFLALGSKRTGTMYSEDDLNMLQTLANQAALAIENAQFYQQERERQAELFHAASIADLGTMASSMSHQLNNPFCIIAGTAQNREEYLRRLLKQSTELPEAVRRMIQDEVESLKSIQEEAMEGSNIIATIRGITASQEEARPLLLAEAVNVALPIAQYKVPFNRLDFRQELPETLPRIWGNRAHLAQCFISFIENAWDAIQARQDDRKLPPPPSGYKGLIRLAGSTVTEPDPSTKKLTQWVLLTISDNGIGLKPEDLRKLFIPFFTTKATAEKAMGSLFVVRRIIEAHDGTVSADSVYGTGTTFKVRLPVLRDEDVERRTAARRITGNGR